MASKKASKSHLPVLVKEEVVQRDSVDSLLQLAIDKNVDIEKLQKLLDMKERNDREASRRLFIEAMSKFQGLVPPLTKDKNVNFNHKDGSGSTNYWYHTLPAIEKHIKPHLAACGLSYRWDQKEEEKKISVWLIISHVGGHVEIGNAISGLADDSGKKNAIQQKASTITYLRRYTLTGGFGLSSGDHDDDGKTAGKVVPEGNDLPALKDGQINSTILKLFKGETTWEYIDAKCIVTEDQRELINKGLDKMILESK